MTRHGPHETPAKPKSTKSVRWTGRDHHGQAGPSQPPTRPALRSPAQAPSNQQEDYFSFSGASGNVSAGQARPSEPTPLQGPSPPRAQSNRPPRGYVIDEEDDDSSSDSDSDSDDDEHSQHFRAATRANTWFNRLRDGDEDPEDAVNEPLYPPSPPAAAAASAPPTQLPSIEISHATANPFSGVMDIGTKTSGGLAPGGAELRPEDRSDPLDDEYRERRNRLLSVLGAHSQPSSPDLPPIAVSREMDAIPLVRLDRPPEDSSDSASPSSPFNFSVPFGPSGPSGTSPSTPDPTHDAIEAQHLREQLDYVQRKRGHEAEEAIANRKAQAQELPPRVRSGDGIEYQTNDDDEHPVDHRPSSPPHRPGSPRRRHSLESRHSRDGSASNHSHKSEGSKEEDKAAEEEELRRLEEIARQEAEEHARQLVKSHLGTNLLSSKRKKNDGYVENTNYLLDADLLDHEEDEDEDETNDDGRKDQEQTNDDGTRQRRNDDSSTDSYDSAKVEKDNYDSRNRGRNNHESDSSSDSENEDDEPRRKVNLRGDPDYVPAPKRVKEGVLGSLLKLYAQEDDAQSTHSTVGDSPSVSLTPTPAGTPLNSPQGTPLGTPSEETPIIGEGSAHTGSHAGLKKWKRPGYFRTQSSEDALGRESKGRPKWYKSKSSTHTPSLGQLAASGLAAAGTAATHAGQDSLSHFRASNSGQLTPTGGLPSMQEFASHFKPSKPSDDLGALRDKEARKKAKKAEQQKRDQQKKLKKARLAEQARITVHIADVLQRQRFILRLCRALMLFGAPSHRLEEYLKITARVLEIDGQFLYMPGCMLVSFGDATTHTSETKLVKVTQGLNLAKLDATHLIYKEVVHDIMGLEEASSHIDHLLRTKNMYPWYLVVLFYAMGCVCSGMYSFGAHWQDMPLIFLVGGGVGFLQYWAQPRSDLYSNVFEVSSSIIVSFIGRAFGSIGHGDKHRVFCFAAIVQGSLALILPGYIILTGALELQSRNLVAGSVRMFYANIYSLFLSFGITLGSAIYGWCDPHGASGETKCHRHIDDKWKILFVPMATFFMGMVNQAGPRQLPVMVAVGSGGYVVQYFVQKQVEDASSFTSAIGAFTMGIMGNLYSRVGHGLAFAAMLPGIFTLVPSGLAAQGSLVAGVAVADAIVNKNSTNATTTTGAAGTVTTTSAGDMTAASSSAAISELGNSMTQVAVGITVGLFAATLVVYPLGLTKKRSGLFTF